MQLSALKNENGQLLHSLQMKQSELSENNLLLQAAKRSSLRRPLFIVIVFYVPNFLNWKIDFKTCGHNCLKTSV